MEQVLQYRTNDSAAYRHSIKLYAPNLPVFLYYQTSRFTSSITEKPGRNNFTIGENFFLNISAISIIKFDLTFILVKTMAEKEFCDNCNQKHNCSSIYHQLGHTNGPSVVVKVVIAFLLPLVVFIISIAIFEEIFAKAVNSQLIHTALSMVSALLVTFSCILILRVINKRAG